MKSTDFKNENQSLKSHCRTINNNFGANWEKGLNEPSPIYSLEEKDIENTSGRTHINQIHWNMCSKPISVAYEYREWIPQTRMINQVVRESLLRDAQLREYTERLTRCLQDQIVILQKQIEKLKQNQNA